MCVEIVCTKDKLDHFCRTHGELLKGKVILYKHIEHWDIHDNELEVKDGSPRELKSGLI